MLVHGRPGGCVTSTQDLADSIALARQAYHVNVHTTESPAGAIRGQLVLTGA